MSDPLLSEILSFTRDGEWGKGEPADGLVKMGVIRGTDFEKVRRGDLSSIPVRYIPKKAADRKTLQPKDILFETAGGTKDQPTGRSVFLKSELFDEYPLPLTCASFSRFLRVQPGSISAEYLFWYLQYLWSERLIYHYHIQHTGVARFQYTQFASEQRIPVLAVSDQDAITKILQALDDKIALNRRLSATLEEMARALYRSWFVDFDPVHARALGQSPVHMDATTAVLFPDSFGPDGLPKGWKPGALGDIAKNFRQQVQPGEIDNDTPYIGLEHMPRRSIALSDWGDAGQVGSAKSAMRRGQILFGKLRPYFHKVGIVPTDGICSTDIVVLDAKSDCWRELVLCIVSSDDFVDHTNASSGGTRMPRTSWKDMASYDIAVAPENVAQAFSSMVRPMTAKIVSCVHEARTLAALRDALLPRLMSGELRIKDAEKQVEEVL